MKGQRLILVLAVSLVLGGAAFGQTAKQALPRVQKVTVNLGRSFRPSSLRLRANIPAEITFIRTTDQTCGKSVLIPDYGIDRMLPLNEKVTVMFTPEHTGTFNFTCGMRMLRGKIIVR